MSKVNIPIFELLKLENLNPLILNKENNEKDETTENQNKENNLNNNNENNQKNNSVDYFRTSDEYKRNENKNDFYI